MFAERKRRKWSHHSVRSLMLSEQSNDPVGIIRNRAKEVVAWGKSMGWSGPPFDPQLLASLRGIRVKESTKLFSAEAQLTPVSDSQLLLEFNPERATGRRNYSICHEIAHTLFDDCFEMVHQRKSDPREFDPEEEVEQLCQIAASEILMPEADFLSDLRQLGFALSTVLGLADRYGASREAVARRMLNFSERPAALVFFSRRLKPVEEEAIAAGAQPPEKFSPLMRILYSVSNGFPFFLPQHKSVPESSCINQINQTDLIKSSVENWGIRDGGDIIVEALGLPTPEIQDEQRPSVLALISPA